MTALHAQELPSSMKTSRGSDESLRCSFCHKSQDAVAKLISSPSDYPRAYICDECVAVCNSILEDDRSEAAAGRCAGAPAEAAGGQGVSGRVRDRPGPDQEEAGGGGLQPLQAHPDEQDARQRCGAGEVEHSAGRADGFRQDAAGADAGEDAGCAVCDCGRDDADRSRVCRRGRREHHPEAAAGGRRRCDAGAERHHLHRRDRQDRPQGREPFDHARRLGRGRAAGAAEDPGGHGGERSAAGWAQASAPGVHGGRHDQHPVHLRRRVCRAWRR